MDFETKIESLHKILLLEIVGDGIMNTGKNPPPQLYASRGEVFVFFLRKDTCNLKMLSNKKYLSQSYLQKVFLHISCNFVRNGDMAVLK